MGTQRGRIFAPRTHTLIGPVADGNAALTTACACVRVKKGAARLPTFASLPFVATKKFAAYKLLQQLKSRYKLATRTTIRDVFQNKIISANSNSKVNSHQPNQSPHYGEVTR
jgi:hypothetical protein